MYIAKLYLYCMVSTLPAVGSELHDYDYGSHSLIATYLLTVVLVANCLLLFYEKREKRRRSTTTNLTGSNVVCSVVIAFFSRHSIVLALLEFLTGDPPEVKLGRLLGLCVLFAGYVQYCYGFFKRFAIWVFGASPKSRGMVIFVFFCYVLWIAPSTVFCNSRCRC